MSDTNLVSRFFKNSVLPLFMLLILACCHKNEAANESVIPGKMVIVCDDWNVDNWYTYVDSFEKYEIAITFYVSHFHEMSSIKKEKLLDLQSRGHEIAYHTLYHTTWDSNFSQAEIDEYLRVEIDSGLNLLRNFGLKVNSFAFPGERCDSNIFRLVSNRFDHVRSGNFGYFEYWLRRNTYTLTPDKNMEFWSYSIDNASIFEVDKNMDMIIEDLLSGKNVALLMHSLSDEQILYTTNPGNFFHFMSLIKNRGIQFSTVNDFYN